MITAGEMCDRGMTPISVLDANGIVIRRAITAFDAETGEVESFILTKDGEHIEEPEGEFKKRSETFPAPLIWQQISDAEAQREKSRYWDLEGR